jgi:hypothetical protein
MKKRLGAMMSVLLLVTLPFAAAQAQENFAPLGEFSAIIRSDIALWAKVVKDAGIPPD